MYKAGIIGYGYWGPNIVRNFNAHPDIDVLKVVDTSAERIKLAQATYPHVQVSQQPDDIFND